MWEEIFIWALVFDRGEGETAFVQQVRRILSSACRIRLKRTWSCMSFRESKPFLVWFPTAEIFDLRPTVEIRLERYPCSEARVTPSLFKHHTRGFPTRRQMLADDLMRCEMLNGASLEELEGAIGPPDERSDERGGSYLYYFLGPERDSLVRLTRSFSPSTYRTAECKQFSFSKASFATFLASGRLTRTAVASSAARCAMTPRLRRPADSPNPSIS